MAASYKTKVEYGDFQTPLDLAEKCVQRIRDKISNTKTLIEPTCGKGNFLKASLKLGFENYVGWEINNEYVDQAKSFLTGESLEIEKRDFFSIDWNSDINFDFPVTFIGNPPWVTNAVLGQIRGENLPKKSNFQNRTGFDAISGKSNFDISECMLIKIMDFISGNEAFMAFLIKTSVARKLFIRASNNLLAVSDFEIYEIDAKKHFGVSVDACFFVASGMKVRPENYRCKVYPSLTCLKPRRAMGVADGKIIADIKKYEALKSIDCGSEFQWRSGIKHDCSQVMELGKTAEGLQNGFGEITDLPNEYLYPMYKSSSISKGTLSCPDIYMVVTQEKAGQETSSIRDRSPRIWEYLNKYKDRFDSRRSTIYKKAPPFAVFGVGEYTFKPWKIGISGLYKNRRFQLIRPYNGKPVVLDDTCYSLGFDTKQEAEFVLELLTSSVAGEFISSIVFEDNKRPITAGLLNRISLFKIALMIGKEKTYRALFQVNAQIPLRLEMEATV